MTNEVPERIFVVAEYAQRHIKPDPFEDRDQVEYIRADLLAAKDAEIEALKVNMEIQTNAQ